MIWIKTNPGLEQREDLPRLKHLMQIKIGRLAAGSLYSMTLFAAVSRVESAPVCRRRRYVRWQTEAGKVLP